MRKVAVYFFASTSAGASSGVVFTCKSVAKENQAGAESIGIERFFVFEFFRVIGLEENVKRLVLHEEARDARHDRFAIDDERRTDEFRAQALPFRLDFGSFLHRHELAGEQDGAERHFAGLRGRHGKIFFERADFAGLIFARDKFQVVIPRGEHYPALIEQVLLVDFGETLRIEIYLRRVAQLRDGLAGGHGANVHGKIKLRLAVPVFFGPFEGAGGNFGGDGNVGLIVAQAKHPGFDRDGQLDDRIIGIDGVG